MSNNPTNNNGADLGSAWATIGFRYDPRGLQQFTAAAGQAVQAQQQLATAGQRTAQAAQTQAAAQTAGARASRQQVQTQRQQVQAATQLARAEAAVARAMGNTADEIAALRRAQTAAMGDRISYLRVTEQLVRAENRLQREQARRNNGPAAGGQQALPRTFAGFTAAGATQALGAAGVVVSVDALIGKLTEAGEESIQLANRAETIGTAYEAATQRAGVASDDLIDKLRAASRETVTTTELQASANKALALGVGADAQQIADLLTVARARGKDFGISTQQAFEDIVTGLGRVSPLILDNLGITVDLEGANARYAAQLGKAADELTEQEQKQALVNDVLRVNRQLLEDAGTAALDNADKQAIALARQEEALVRIGRVLAPIKAEAAATTANILELLTGGIQEATTTANDALLSNVTTYEEYTARLNTATGQVAGGVREFFRLFTGIPLPDWLVPYSDGLERLTPIQVEFGQQLIETGVSAEEAARLVREFRGELELIAGDETETGDALRALVPEILRIAAASPTAAARLEELVKQAQDSGDVEQLRQYLDNTNRSLEEQADKAAYAASSIRRLGDESSTAATKSKELADAQKALGDEILRAGEQIADAQERRDEGLQDAYDRYEERTNELEERRAEITADAEEQIAETLADGVDERARIAQDGADRIAEIQSDLDDRLADLARDYRETEAREEEQFQREQQQARERARVDELQGEADFIERLFDLTRGRRGGAGVRDQAKAQLEAAKKEAAELAKIDPEAAARLLAARERQILEALERRREEAQQKRDAARGIPGYSRKDASQEAAEERAAIDAANTAEIEQIKREAQQRADARATEKTQRDADYAEQVQDAKDQAAEQIADVREATREQLAALDERQRERIAQIREHAREQQAEIDQQLLKEKASYDRARDQIQSDYESFLRELQETLRDEADKLQFTPDQQRQRELLEAYEAMGSLFGAGFVQALQQAIDATTIQGPVFQNPASYGQVPQNVGNGTRPTSGGGSGTTARTPAARGGSVALGDPTLSARAIDQVVLNGVQSDSYSALRGNDLHRGVDLAAPEGKAINSPVDGTILKSDATAAWGNYTIVKTASGDLWYFGHMQKPGLKAGTAVRRGQRIGTVGSTGAVTGPHVHVQLTRGGRVVDPTAALEQLATPRQPSGRVGGTEAGATQTLRSSSATQNVGGTSPVVSPGEPVSAAYLATTQLQTPPPVTSAGTSSTSLVVDMRGSSYGAGVDPLQVQRMVEQGARRVLSEYEQAEARRIEQRRLSGGRRLT